MYKYKKAERTTINLDKCYLGETIEQKMHRVVNNKEPITDGAPIVYTERKNGVEPQYNIRADRWEIAVDAMDAVAKQHAHKRQENLNKFTQKLDDSNKNNKPESGEK